MPSSIIIIGASGLIGKQVLRQSLENPEIRHVIILVRKPFNLKHPKLNEIITDFKDLTELESSIKGDALICCLGTTRKKSPNLKDYKKIDFDLTVNLARIAKQQNVEQIHLISAVGADSESKIFYNRLKGEIEEAIIKLDFSRTFIYRPSLLIGKRNEFRFGELIAQKLMPIIDILLVGSLKKYHSIPANEIAKAVIKSIFIKGQKVQILEFKELQLLQC
jgi:uncharacterized protein YbjT (DUF2867 family)